MAVASIFIILYTCNAMVESQAFGRIQRISSLCWLSLPCPSKGFYRVPVFAMWISAA